MLDVLAFLLGAAVGSFLNVVVDRLPPGQPIPLPGRGGGYRPP